MREKTAFHGNRATTTASALPPVLSNAVAAFGVLGAVVTATLVVFAVAGAQRGMIGGSGHLAGGTHAGAQPAQIPSTCGTIDPPIALVRYQNLRPGEDGSDAAIEVLTRDSADRVTVATFDQVGSVLGLAYDATRNSLFAAAYHKRGVRFGPGGPGAVYQIDMDSGAVSVLATLAAGQDRHKWAADDHEAGGFVGRTSLGGLAVSGDGSALFVANLFDRTVVQLALPGGAEVDRFSAVDGVPWFRTSRLLGLAVHDGWLYRGLTDVAGTESGDRWPVGYAYRSRFDGSDLELIARTETERSAYGNMSFSAEADDDLGMAQIVFDSRGRPVVGVRNQSFDTFLWDTSMRYDLPGAWLAATGSEDGVWQLEQLGRPSSHPRTPPEEPDVSGGLARIPGIDLLVAPGLHKSYLYGPGFEWRWKGNLQWFDAQGGIALSPLPVDDETLIDPPFASGYGSVEVLCAASDEIDEELAGTATALVPTEQARATESEWPLETPDAGATGTAAVQRATARPTDAAATVTALARLTGTASPDAPPQTRTASPTPQEPRVTPSSSPTIVATTTRTSPLEPTRFAALASVTAAAPTQLALATRATLMVPPATGTAAAQTRLTIESACQAGDGFFVVACISPSWELRQPPVRVTTNDPVLVASRDEQPDDVARHFVLAGSHSAGAIFGLAYDWRKGIVYAAAYNKRLAEFGPGGPGAIYRTDLSTGATTWWASLPAGVDPHRVSAQWDEPAGPLVGRVSLGDLELNDSGSELFAVNLHDGLIYRLDTTSGTVLDIILPGSASESWSIVARPFGLGFRDGWLYHGVVDTQLTAAVYRSRPDGSEMREILSARLDYPRLPAWSAWGQTYAPTGPMLTDIEFRPNGDPILGFRDRLSDSAFAVGQGDLIPTYPSGLRRWFAWLEPEHYPDTIVHDESAWGGLAAVPGRDEIVTSALDPWTANSAGLLWYDNALGILTGREMIYDYTMGVTYLKAAGLGDVESLCPPLPPTPSPTATASPTPTASPTSTATPTRTPEPGTIYLPAIYSRFCLERTLPADVVLVIDASTSMLREAADGRQKLEAVQSAAVNFVATLDLEGRRDRVAVVGFNDRVWVQTELTSSASVARLAVVDLRAGVAEGTRLDLAISGGLAAFGPVPLPEDRSQVIVMLTDGLPNRVPTPTPHGSQEDTVLAQAEVARGLDVDVYAIGVGQPESDDIADRINPDLLAAVATRPEMFYQTPNASDLEAIYGAIARSIGCR